MHSLTYLHVLSLSFHGWENQEASVEDLASIKTCMTRRDNNNNITNVLLLNEVNHAATNDRQLKAKKQADISDRF